MKPILVTGSHRSGTTWLGKLIALDPHVTYVHEPFNPDAPTGFAPHSPDVWFLDVDCHPELAGGVDRDVAQVAAGRLTPFRSHPAVTSRAVAKAMAQVAYSRIRSGTFLFKDPIAFFSAEWFERALGAQVVVCQRHPAAFVMSILKLRWRFDFGNFVRQPLLLEHRLSAYSGAIHKASSGGIDPVSEAILLWQVFDEVTRRYARDHPDWVFVRHEELARDHEAELPALMDQLSVRVPRSARRELRRLTDGVPGHEEAAVGDRSHTYRRARQTVGNWRQSLPSEVALRVRRSTEGSSYDDPRWW